MNKPYYLQQYAIYPICALQLLFHGTPLIFRNLPFFALKFIQTIAYVILEISFFTSDTIMYFLNAIDKIMWKRMFGSLDVKIKTNYIHTRPTHYELGIDSLDVDAPWKQRLAFVYSADEKFIACGAADGIMLWNTEDGGMLETPRYDPAWGKVKVIAWLGLMPTATVTAITDNGVSIVWRYSPQKKRFIKMWKNDEELCRSST